MSQATYNFPDLVRGDTIRAKSFTFTIDTNPASIVSARLMFRYSGSLIYTASCAVAGNIVTMGEVAGSVTAKFPINTLNYDLELTLAGGLIRTYVTGTMKITQDYSY